MKLQREIVVGDRVYRKEPAVDRYQIPVHELGDLRMMDIPPHSHLEIIGLPEPCGVSEMECYGLNSGDDGKHELSVYGGAGFQVRPEHAPHMVARLRRAFPEGEPDAHGIIRNPQISTHVKKGGILAYVFLNLAFNDAPETRVHDAVMPFVEGYLRLARPSVHVFICHASEDKAAARTVAAGMKRLGADVWFDEWEIRVGESIVQKIGDALGRVSHLVVLFSQQSVAKPWVQKEFSAALMRQLSRESIKVLPLRLDDCTIPPILADIKYADARHDMALAIAELERALFTTTDAAHE